jgi:hypothetical protein
MPQQPPLHAHTIGYSSSLITANQPAKHCSSSTVLCKLVVHERSWTLKFIHCNNANFYYWFLLVPFQLRKARGLECPNLVAKVLAVLWFVDWLSESTLHKTIQWVFSPQSMPFPIVWCAVCSYAACSLTTNRQSTVAFMIHGSTTGYQYSYSGSQEIVALRLG